MKIKIQLLLVVMLLGNVSFAQTDSVKVPLKELEEIRTYFKEQTKDTEKNKKKIYSRNYTQMIAVCDLVKDLRLTINYIENDKSSNKFTSLIASANNPTSDKLGFRLTDKIEEILEKELNKPQHNIPKSKSTVIKGTIKNLLSGLGSLFPPLQMVSSVITSISTFTSTEASATNAKLNDLKRVSDLLSATEAQGVSPAFVKSFRDQLAPYIALYTELEKVNKRFGNSEILLANSQTFKDDFGVFYNDFEAGIGISLSVNKSVTPQVLQMFEVDNDKKGDLSIYNNSKSVQYLNSSLDQVYEMILDFNKYAQDYNTVLKTNVDSYITVLSSTVNLEKNDVQLQQFLSDLKETYYGNASSNVEGFSNKYKENIAAINSKIRQIRAKVAD